VGERPIAVTAGDLNGDGTADLASANAWGGTVSVLLGHGDGDYAPASHFEAGDMPSHLVAHDLDGDGRLDLAIATASPAGITVLFNDE
jgi:hypothetical protein